MGMNSMPRARSSFTQWMMSVTVRARCCTPAPRSSSLKMLICELRKNGRQGSLFANLTPERGSHITIERSPEPWLRSGTTSVVWNSISQYRSKPITCSIHRMAGARVGKFEVVWS